MENKPRLREVILFGGPDPAELRSDASSHHGGAQHLRASFTRELLRAGHADRIVLLTRSDQRDRLREALSGLEGAERADVLTGQDLAGRAPFAPGTAVHSLDIGLAGALHLSASFTGGVLPVTAMTHDLFNSRVFRDLAMACLIDHPPITAVACASASARGVLTQMLRCLAGRMVTSLRVALPIIPHGVDAGMDPSGMDPSGMDPSDTGPRRRTEARRQLGLAADNLVLLYIGRLSLSTKADLLALITACTRLRFVGPITLVLAGGAGAPSEQAALQQAADAAMATGPSRLHIRIEPNITDARKAFLLTVADIFVSPANCLQESFGLALVEAMAAGLPVVASDWNGYREIVIHGVTGLLVPTVADRAGFADLGRFRPLESDAWLYRNAGAAVRIRPDDLRDALDCFAIDHRLRQSCGDHARQAARRFTMQRMIRRYERLWTLLLAAGARRTSRPSAGLPPDFAQTFADHPTRWR